MIANSQIGSPVNPKVLRGAALCVRAAAVKTIAGTMPQELKVQLVNSADATINALTDDFCGTPSPHPWPGPSTLALDLAALITVYANTRVQPGQFQANLMEIAGGLVKKAYKTAGHH
jgi:hypothetical protein